MSRRREDVPEEERVYITQAADLLERRIGTLRKWESTGVLPTTLLPRRGKRGWRYWTPAQIDGIREWLVSTDRRPSRGLPHVDKRNADPEKVRQQIKAMRKGRGPKKRHPRTSTGAQNDAISSDTGLQAGQ